MNNTNIDKIWQQHTPVNIVLEIIEKKKIMISMSHVANSFIGLHIIMIMKWIPMKKCRLNVKCFNC